MCIHVQQNVLVVCSNEIQIEGAGRAKGGYFGTIEIAGQGECARDASASEIREIEQCENEMTPTFGK